MDIGFLRKFLVWVVVFGEVFMQEESICTISSTNENPSCFCNQLESIPQCPSNFIDTDYICYHITLPSTYPPQCPFENIIPFNSYKEIIPTNASIWMPIKRDVSNGLGFLEWIEPSTLYKTEFTQDFQYEGGIKGKDCVIYYNGTFKAVPCDEEYSRICAYYKLDQNSDQLCCSLGMCHHSDFNADSKCFCVGGSDLNQANYVKAEFLKSYQNLIYSSLTLDDCTIGLESSNGSYIWVNSKQPIDYCYWSSEANFGSTNIYGAATQNGWVLTAEPLYCFLYEQEIHIPEARLNLMFNSADMRFVLQIENPSGLKKLNSETLLYCFSNAGALSLTYRYEGLTRVDGNGTVYEFEPHTHGPGYYWCEAFNYVNLQPIKSEVLLFNQSERFGVEFVAILKTKYIAGTNPLRIDLIEFLERIFFIKLNLEMEKTRCSYSSRLMKIMDVDEDNYEALLNIHFTCIIRESTIRPVASSMDDEYDKMETLVNNTVSNLPDIDIEMVDFRSASYCLEESLNGLTWPKTDRHRYIVPEEYCFTRDGLRLKRLCGGDFINGAQWGDVEDCTIPTQSSVTEELLKISRDEVDPLDDVYEISGRYLEFDCFDVYLVALIASNHWENVTDMDPLMFVATLDNLLNVKESTLIDAQNEMRAMDMILDTIDNVATQFDINSSNIVTVAETSGVSTGLVLMPNGSFVSLTSYHTYDSLMASYEDLEGAIWVGSNIRKDTELVFKLFYNNVFFTDSQSSENSVPKVFGVLIPNSFSSSVFLLYKAPNSSAETDCVYWEYNLDSPDGRGSWKVALEKQLVSPYLVCDFSDVKTSALTIRTTGESNQLNSVTENLEKLLQSNETSSEIINELSSLSDRYWEFDSEDIYLVGQILEKISNEADIDLYALAHIVSNLHEIKQTILSQSQREKNATDTVLHGVDAILQNHNYLSIVNVTESNFMIYMTNVIETDFSGLILLNSQHLQTQSLTGEIAVDEVLEYDFITAFLLPSGLKQQLVDDAKVIVTIFSTDGLFNEDGTTYRYVSKIFGVILPLLGNYSEPLSFIHKVSEDNYQRSCVYWLYNTTESVSGLWKIDTDGKNISSFSQCDFWHTTHFALLLLDSDEYDDDILGWITTINCALSMVGLCCIILTAILFKRWRTNSGNQILLNFVLASVLQICVFYVSNSISKKSDDYLFCTIIGVVLHYSVVSQFCWMLVIAILQFKRFVEVLTAPPKHVLLKACLCGWVLPCLPVVCVYFLNNDTYVSGNVGLCYPSGFGLYLGVWLPIAIVVVINFVIFVFIIYSVVHRKTECSDVRNGEVMFQWRLAILLFFMLGMTWAFGFLAELEFGVVFVYVFSMTATLQGFVMFLFFIVFNANTRYLYVNVCKKQNKYS